MRELPYYKMWVKDFDTNENVRVLDFAELGLYVACLNHSWRNDGLPSDPREIARAIKATPKVFAKLWPRVSKCFALSDDGRVRNKRQEEERTRAAEKSAKSSQAVEIREKRRIERSSNDTSNDHPRALARADYAYDSVSGSSSEELEQKTNFVPREPVPIRTSRFPVAEWAERLYSQHPKKRERPLVEEACLKILKKCEDLGVPPQPLFEKIARIHALWAISEDWLKENARYCPRLAIWLDDEGWTTGAPARASPVPKEQIWSDLPSWQGFKGTPE
jgi:uncharacterized protein YdaU (DUF1376 family)